VLVTGASGFLGSHIAEHFAAAEHTVRVLVRKTSSREFLWFPHEEAIGDVTVPKSLMAAVEGVDAVVHAAGLIKARSEDEFKAVNEIGTANLVRAAEAIGCRFIYISSLAAHGPGKGDMPRPIDAPSRPVSAYGRTKLAGESVVRSSALADRSVIFRMPVIYGPRDPALVPFFQIARWRVAPLLDGGRNLVSVIYADDAASAVLRVTNMAAGPGMKIYSPEDGGVHSWRDLLAAAESAIGRHALAVSVPRLAYSAAAAASEAYSRIAGRAVVFTRDKVREMAAPAWLCSSEDLRRDTGWEPRVMIGEGARLTYRWYSGAGWI
jgi:nucleoside-diphosphate-sugar epimerase